MILKIVTTIDNLGKSATFAVFQNAGATAMTTYWIGFVWKGSIELIVESNTCILVSFLKNFQVENFIISIKTFVVVDKMKHTLF